MRVVICDDSVLLREGVARILEEAGFDVVGQAGNVDELMLKVRSYSPAVAVVEIADDGVGGADATQGSGLRGLADRVEALDGLLKVRSEPGNGTTIRAEIPVG